MEFNIFSLDSLMLSTVGVKIGDGGVAEVFY